MKKVIFVIALLIFGGAGVWFLSQNKVTTFGEVFDDTIKVADVYEVVLEEKQRENPNNKTLDLEQFEKIIELSREMKIKESEYAPMNTYELSIYYKDNGEEKYSAIVVGYNNTLQMPDGKFYKIDDRNLLFEAIYQDS